MIVLGEKQPQGVTPRADALPDLPPEKPAPAFFPHAGETEPSTLEAAIGQSNPIANAVRWLGRPSFEPDPTFTGDKLLDVIGGLDGPYQADLDNLAGAQSEPEARQMMGDFDRENSYRDTMGRSGIAGVVATVGAGLADPTILIPIGGLVKAGRMGWTGMKAVRAMEGAALSAAAVAAQEGVLQGTQETRTSMESLFNIGAATVVGGVLGGALGRLGAGEVDALGRAANRLPATRAEEADLYNSAVTGGADAGAARADAVRGTGERKYSAGAEQKMAFQGPQPRLQNSPFKASRNIVRDLAEDPNNLAENADGIATTTGGAVETQAKMARAPLADSLADMDTAYRGYAFGQSSRVPRTFAPAMGTLGSRLGIGAAAGKMSYSEFKAQVWEALLSGDVHAIPEVAASAKSLRTKVFDPLRDEAMQHIPGFRELVESGSADPSYLTRMWNRNAISSDSARFVDVLTQHFTAKQSDIVKMIASLEKKASDKAFEADLVRGNVAAEAARFASRRNELKAQAAAARAEATASGKAMRAGTRAFEKEQRAADRARKTLYRNLLADLKRGRPSERFSDIVSFIRAKGGIRLSRLDAVGRRKFETAYGAEIADVVGKGNRGIISKSGSDPDLMLRLAIDEGYLPPTADLNDLVEAIDDTLKGNPVFSQLDAEAVAAQASIRATVAELERAGVDVNGLTPESLAEMLAPGGKADSPSVRAIAKDIEDLAERFDNATLGVEEITRLADDLKEMAPDLVEAARAARAAIRDSTKEANQINRRISDAQKFADLTPAELRDIANETKNTILGFSPARHSLPTDMAAAGPRGPLKERMLASLPTKLVRDFVERDPEVIARFYTHTMSTDTALARKFGSVDLQSEVARINDEADALLAEKPNGKPLPAKEQKRINDQRADDIRDLEGIRDRLRGTYGVPDNPDGLIYRVARVLRDLNYLRLLGGMTISSISDIGKPVFVHGLDRTMRAAWLPFTSGLRQMRLAAKEVKLAGAALDMILDDRIMSLNDIMDNMGRGSRFERGLKAATTKFGVVSLMAPWNAFWKQFTGIITQTRMLQAIEEVVAGKAAPKEIEYLAGGGIDHTMAQRIAAEFQAHGVKDKGGLYWANTSEWTDRQAIESYRAMIVRDVDRVIVTPGQEKPLWMSTELGKVVGQFKTFNMASMQRTIASGMQQRDAAALMGTMTMLGLGALSYKLKMDLAGAEVSDNPAVWATEALDRSGIAGWLMDVNNIAEKTALRPFTIGGLTGVPASRYASRNMYGAVLGPSADIIGDVLPLGMTGQWSQSDTRALRKMIPLQNLFYIRALFDAVEKGGNDALGVPARKAK